jgi:hypothetical protein
MVEETKTSVENPQRDYSKPSNHLLTPSLLILPFTLLIGLPIILLFMVKNKL